MVWARETTAFRHRPLHHDAALLFEEDEHALNAVTISIAAIVRIFRDLRFERGGITGSMLLGKRVIAILLCRSIPSEFLQAA
jgi:hypothetical protein